MCAFQSFSFIRCFATTNSIRANSSLIISFEVILVLIFDVQSLIKDDCLHRAVDHSSQILATTIPLNKLYRLKSCIVKRPLSLSLFLPLSLSLSLFECICKNESCIFRGKYLVKFRKYDKQRICLSVISTNS